MGVPPNDWFIRANPNLKCLRTAGYPHDWETSGLRVEAPKILLSPEDLISTSTSRDDVVALVNILWKMSDSLEARAGRGKVDPF